MELQALQARAEKAEGEAGRLRAVLRVIGHDHETMAQYAVKGEWHGAFNWVQDLAKAALEEGE